MSRTGIILSSSLLPMCELRISPITLATDSGGSQVSQDSKSLRRSSPASSSESGTGVDGLVLAVAG